MTLCMPCEVATGTSTTRTLTRMAHLTRLARLRILSRLRTVLPVSAACPPAPSCPAARAAITAGGAAAAVLPQVASRRDQSLMEASAPAVASRSPWTATRHTPRPMWPRSTASSAPSDSRHSLRSTQRERFVTDTTHLRLLRCPIVPSPLWLQIRVRALLRS